MVTVYYSYSLNDYNVDLTFLCSNQDLNLKTNRVHINLDIDNDFKIDDYVQGLIPYITGMMFNEPFPEITLKSEI